jgi:hypothetical protein
MSFGIFGGPGSTEMEAGIVAERCPHCRQVAACLVVEHFRPVYLYGIPVWGIHERAMCWCGLCGNPFSCEMWRYPAFVPAAEAGLLTTNALLDRTNPMLKERLAWEQQQQNFDADPSFRAILDSLDQIRPGRFHTELKETLLRWDRLTEDQRANLVQRTDAWVRTLQFARQVGQQFPKNVGCLAGFLVCLPIWSAFFWWPDVRTLVWGGLVVFAGFGAGVGVQHLLLTRRMRSWVKEFLIPEARSAGVEFPIFLAVLEDGPPLPRDDADDLRELKDQLATIRGELAAAGTLPTP